MISTKVLAKIFLGLWLAFLLLPLGGEEYRAAAQSTGNKAEASLERKGESLRLTIGNQAIRRVVELGPRGARTTAIINQFSGNNYLSDSRSEFRLVLSRELAHEDRTITLTSDDFTLKDSRWITQSDKEQQISFTFQGVFENAPVTLVLYYQALADTNFVRKWFNVAPFQAKNWSIKWATLEDWQAGPDLAPLGLFPRYSQTYSNNQPKYAEADKDNSVITTNPGQRFAPTQVSRQAMLHTNAKEGLFFFQESLFGQEVFKDDRWLGIGNSDFVDPAEGFSSGRSVLGAWQGPAEIGIKRYNDYIYNQYAVIKNKRDPVWFSTWYIFENQINQQNMLDMLNRMQSAGFYDLLHLDAGWEENAPLQLATSPQKFPNGLTPLLNKMKATNYTLGIWMSPFSGRYQDYVSYAPFFKQHPEWVQPNTSLLCPLSGAGNYIRDRLLKLAQDWPLEEIYWDGLDWHIAACNSPERNWTTPDQAYILTLKYYAKLMQDLRAIRPNIRVVLWSPPSDIHWLGAVDQLQLSDMYDVPLGASELSRRQQLYYASMTLPNSAIWGDWYGLGFRRSREEGIGAPLNLTEFATMTQLGNGATQAGGSFDLANVSPDLVKFVGKMFAFRKAFADYFKVYQNILNFPDGQSIDGEAHLIDGKGFLLLYNPSKAGLTLDLPLNEPSLELNPDQIYTLTDWSNLESGQVINQSKPGDKVNITIPASSWKIIGLNMPQSLSKP